MVTIIASGCGSGHEPRSSESRQLTEAIIKVSMCKATALLLIGKGFSRQTDKENTGESSERKEVYAKLI